MHKYPPPRLSWWCQAHFGTHLRRDPSYSSSKLSLSLSLDMMYIIISIVPALAMTMVYIYWACSWFLESCRAVSEFWGSETGLRLGSGSELGARVSIRIWVRVRVRVRVGVKLRVRVRVRARVGLRGRVRVRRVRVRVIVSVRFRVMHSESYDKYSQLIWFEKHEGHKAGLVRFTANTHDAY